MEGWKERAGRNEALFRNVNDNIAKLEQRMDSGSESLPVICECARAECTTQIEIRISDYAAVREHADWFILARGHEQPGVEKVVDQGRDYVVVEKLGIAAESAEAST